MGGYLFFSIKIKCKYNKFLNIKRNIFKPIQELDLMINSIQNPLILDGMKPSANQ
jgi:hypothetical protein